MIDSLFCLVVYNSWTRNMLIMDAGAARAHKLMLRTSRDDLSFGIIPEWNFSEKKYGKSRFSWDPARPCTTTFMENENHFLSYIQ